MRAGAGARGTCRSPIAGTYACVREKCMKWTRLLYNYVRLRYDDFARFALLNIVLPPDFARFCGSRSYTLFPPPPCYALLPYPAPVLADISNNAYMIMHLCISYNTSECYNLFICAMPEGMQHQRVECIWTTQPIAL